MSHDLLMKLAELRAFLNIFIDFTPAKFVCFQNFEILIFLVTLIGGSIENRLCFPMEAIKRVT